MMDYSILYGIGIAILAVITMFGVIYLMKKFNISTGQLTDGVNITKTIATTAKIVALEMGFGTEEEVNKIVDILNDALDYVKSIATDTTKEQKINSGTKFIEDTCVDLGIEMNSDRLFVVTTIFTLALNLTEVLVEKVA